MAGHPSDSSASGSSPDQEVHGTTDRAIVKNRHQRRKTTPRFARLPGAVGGGALEWSRGERPPNVRWTSCRRHGADGSIVRASLARGAPSTGSAGSPVEARGRCVATSLISAFESRKHQTRVGRYMNANALTVSMLKPGGVLLAAVAAVAVAVAPAHRPPTPPAHRARSTTI